MNKVSAGQTWRHKKCTYFSIEIMEVEDNKRGKTVWYSLGGTWKPMLYVELVAMFERTFDGMDEVIMKGMVSAYGKDNVLDYINNIDIKG